MAHRLPSWRDRVADEFNEQQGGLAKAWWVVRFAAALLTIGNCDFGIAALGNGDAKFRKAVRKAEEPTRGKPRH